MDFIFIPTVISVKKAVWVPVPIFIRGLLAIMVDRQAQRVRDIPVISEMWE
jgi:hypothetical protein